MTPISEKVLNDLEELKTNTLTDTVSGTSLSITDSANAKIRDLKLCGNINQNNYTGSNLLNFNVEQNSKVTVNDDGTITINGTGGFSLKYEEITLKAGTTYYCKFELMDGSYTGSASDNGSIMDITSTVFMTIGVFKTVTVDEDIQRSSMWINADATFENATFKIWANTDKSDFEPYCGNQASPNQDYPQDIEVVTGDITLKIDSVENTEKEVTLSLENLELCTDEYLYRSQGKWYKHKAWDKIESYADEEIETDYISTTGELSEGATVYYKVDETDEEITDETLISQLEKIYNLKTYKTTTNITTETDNLSPTLEVEYVLDLKTYIDNKISAIST